MLDVLSVVSFLSRTKCPTKKQVVDLSPHKLSHFYRPQRSWAKVIFSQACVENSVHRGGRVSASVHAGIHPPGADTSPRSRPAREQTCPGADTPQSRQPPLWEQTPPEQTPPPRTRLQHTVNERPVRILLECILVLYFTISNVCCYQWHK